MAWLGLLSGLRPGLRTDLSSSSARTPTACAVCIFAGCRQTLRSADLRFASSENEIRFRHEVRKRSSRMAAAAGTSALKVSSHEQ